VLKALYHALKVEKVDLHYTILKPSMVISGKQAKHRAGIEEVAKRTLRVLKEFVPWEVPSINFLSGGQSPQEATAHLNEMHRLDNALPWHLSFSYARALQEPALKAWQGKDENIPKAQEAFVRRCMLNSLAVEGKYDESMEE
jgi:fructose-bisphosphate aldolase class I